MKKEATFWGFVNFRLREMDGFIYWIYISWMSFMMTTGIRELELGDSRIRLLDNDKMPGYKE